MWSGILWGFGCDGDPAEERLRLELGQGADVDTRCARACEGERPLSVRIAYPDDFLPQDEVIELEQYRIDYDVDDVDGGIPFFASRRQTSLAPGESTDLELQVAGAAQREHVFDDVGGDTVAGTATLTLAGYDWDNLQIFLEREFEIRFGDFTGAEE